MANYLITYCRIKDKRYDSKTLTDKNMTSAVKKVVGAARKHLVDINQISVRILEEKDKGGVQRYCDKCLIEPASYGFKNKQWYCKGCK